MSARSRLNGHTTAVPLPVKAAPLSAAEEDAKVMVTNLVKRVGWQGIMSMCDMAMPRWAALAALADGSLEQDETLTKLLGALERGTAGVAAFMSKHVEEIKNRRALT